LQSPAANQELFKRKRVLLCNLGKAVLSSCGNESIQP